MVASNNAGAHRRGTRVGPLAALPIENAPREVLQWNNVQTFGAGVQRVGRKLGARFIDSRCEARVLPRSGWLVRVNRQLRLVRIHAPLPHNQPEELLLQGAQLIDALKKKFCVTSDRALTSQLGVTTAGLQLWKKRDKLTSRQLASLIGAAYNAGSAAIQVTAIRPLVEFFKLDKCMSKQGAKFELFAVDKTHPYMSGLKGELESHHGVYVFFDSRGHAIYAGKARRQNLWKEMTLAFNRNRGEVQGVKRVHHPSRRQTYKTSEEKTRQIVRRVLPLHEMASYVSAYSVVDGMVDEVEAMLVRSFANDLLNVRMEHFGGPKRRN